jgi:hypothetical protein
MGKRFGFRIVIILLVTRIVFPVHAQAIMGISNVPPTDAELKSIEILMQIYGIMLAIVGAVFTFFITNHRAIQKLFRLKERCVSKIIVLFCNVSLVATAFFVLWDLMTLSNQLRNNIVSLDDLIGANISWYALAAALITFIPSSLLLPRGES